MWSLEDIPLAAEAVHGVTSFAQALSRGKRLSADEGPHGTCREAPFSHLAEYSLSPGPKKRSAAPARAVLGPSRLPPEGG